MNNTPIACSATVTTAIPNAVHFRETAAAQMVWERGHFSAPQCESALSSQIEQFVPDIFTAAGRGDLRSLFAHLEAEPGLANAKHPSGGTPLHFAVSADQFEAIQMLLASGANPDATDSVFSESPLTLALLFGSLEIACLLISYGGCENHVINSDVMARKTR